MISAERACGNCNRFEAKKIKNIRKSVESQIKEASKSGLHYGSFRIESKVACTAMSIIVKDLLKKGFFISGDIAVGGDILVKW